VKKRGLYYLLAFILCIGFSLLGRWQLARAEWKQQRLDAVTSVLRDRDEKPVASVLSQSMKVGAIDLTWVSGRGHFLSVPALYLDNQRRGEQVGVHVYRVFQAEQGPPFLLNLGWLPVPGNRDMPKVDSIVGEYTVEGLLLPPPSSGLAMGEAYVKTNQDYWLMTRIDLSALSKDLKLELAPRVLRLDPDNTLGYARDLDILPNTLPPEKHRGYAVQWFGLAIATLVITIILTLRRKKT
jgi:surfeit locus 1 family protein